MEGDLAASLRLALITLARERRTVTYRELAAVAQVPPPQTIHKVTQALEQLMHEDHAAQRPLVAALAISKTGPAVPGRGFFHLARQLGLYDGPEHGTEAEAFHARELMRAWDYWGQVARAKTCRRPSA